MPKRLLDGADQQSNLRLVKFRELGHATGCSNGPAIPILAVSRWKIVHLATHVDRDVTYGNIGIVARDGGILLLSTAEPEVRERQFLSD
jgi:hypothetical protein